MLELLQAIAFRLRALTPVAVVLFVAGIAVFAGSAIGVVPEGYLTPGLLAAIWGVWLFVLTTGLRGALPVVSADQPWSVRLRTRLARAGYVLMAWVILGTGVAAILLSARLLLLWFDGRA
jgi:hypothetical protein